MRALLRLGLAALTALPVACDDAPQSPNAAGAADAAQADDAAPDAALTDGLPPDAARPDAALPDAGPAPTARDYCETVADAYCPYYLRCGRMAAADDAACRARFLESCNGYYEPQYVALEDAGLLRFDPDAVAACAAHLAQVPCAQQVSDLFGPCGALWTGQVPAGGACGANLDYFVCAPDTTCVLGLDFCGTCQPAAALGQGCGGDGPRCGRDAVCQGGTCQARNLPGDPCGDTGCVLGAQCVDGTCAGPTVAAVGEACARDRDCPYAASCVGGVCVAAVLEGEACGADAPCNFGGCVAGRCVAPRPPGAACEAATDCVTGACDGGACASASLGCAQP